MLVEYGEMALGLELDLFVTVVGAGLAERPVPGLVEVAPGFPSLLPQAVAALCRHDPAGRPVPGDVCGIPRQAV